jgi:cytochrome c6
MKKLPLIAAAAALLASPVLLAADAKENWSKMCARCHAEDGSGNTKIGKKLKVKDYTTAEGQAFSDEEGLKAILEGVSEGGKEKMQAYKEKLSEQEAKDLMALIRALKK